MMDEIFTSISFFEMTGEVDNTLLFTLNPGFLSNSISSSFSHNSLSLKKDLDFNWQNHVLYLKRWILTWSIRQERMSIGTLLFSCFEKWWWKRKRIVVLYAQDIKSARDVDHVSYWLELEEKWWSLLHFKKGWSR